MGLDNHIESAMRGILKNPILSVLKRTFLLKIPLKLPTQGYLKQY